MASSIASPNSAAISYSHRKPLSQNLILSPFSVSIPLHKNRLRAIKTKSDGGGAVRSSQETADLLRKPMTSPLDINEVEDEEPTDGGDGDTWLDWEDLILDATVPLVGLVRMILQSGKYESGDRLSPEHERTILERLLPYHPDCEKKLVLELITLRLDTIRILKAQDVYSLFVRMEN
ncbi:hypothetical protein ACS0TY_013286 [Phlomoides rotata]